MKGQMMGVDNQTEYEGGGVMPNTVFPKIEEALTAADKLRLQSITGQETDSQARVDQYFWQGVSILDTTPTPMDVRNARAERLKRAGVIAATNRKRYVQTRRPVGY